MFLFCHCEFLFTVFTVHLKKEKINALQYKDMDKNIK